MSAAAAALAADGLLPGAKIEALAEGEMTVGVQGRLLPGHELTGLRRKRQERRLLDLRERFDRTLVRRAVLAHPGDVVRPSRELGTELVDVALLASGSLSAGAFGGVTRPPQLFLSKVTSEYDTANAALIVAKSLLHLRYNYLTRGWRSDRDGRTPGINAICRALPAT